MARRKSNLLSLSEVVIGISVQHHFSNLDERIITVWNDFSNIKNIPFVAQSLSFRNSLNAYLPLRSLS